MRQRKRSRWYAVDLAHVVEYRREVKLPEPERNLSRRRRLCRDWIRQIRTGCAGCSSILVTAAPGHYFVESKVVGLLRMLTGFERGGNRPRRWEQRAGMAMMRKKYMKQVGHRDAQMFFYVDSASVLAGKIGSGVRVLAEEPYYRHIPRNGLKLSTKISMAVSDRFGMVKLIRISL